jgi:hypothetical protein
VRYDLKICFSYFLKDCLEVAARLEIYCLQVVSDVSNIFVPTRELVTAHNSVPSNS